MTVKELIDRLMDLNMPEADVVTWADGGAGYSDICDPQIIRVLPVELYMGTGQYGESDNGDLVVLISW